MTRPSGYANMLATLTAAGLPAPPIGDISAGAVRTNSEWNWASRDLPGSLYQFNLDRIANELIDRGPIFALRHEGHGLNSYALNLVTTIGPVAAYVQHPWGGVYMEQSGSSDAIANTYASLHLLADTVKDHTGEVRCLAAMSSFGAVTALIDLNQVRAGDDIHAATHEFTQEWELFAAALAQIEHPH